MKKTFLRFTLYVLFCSPIFFLLTGASDLGGGGCNSSSSQTFSVGGTLSGLTGELVLQNNGGDNLTLNKDGSFTFATGLSSGSAYNVTVLQNPEGELCTVSKGSGTVADANITNISIVCSVNSFTVGGTISGLSGTLVLKNSDGQTASVTDASTFQFANALANGSTYEVTVETQPSNYTCTVTHGSGHGIKCQHKIYPLMIKFPQTRLYFLK